MKVIFLMLALVIAQSGFACQDCLKQMDMAQFNMEKSQWHDYYYVNGYDMAIHEAKAILIKNHENEIFVKSKKAKNAKKY